MGVNGNGFIKTVVMYLVATLVTLILFIGFPALINAVVANDRLRQEEDKEIRQEIAGDRKIQNTVNQEILIKLVELQSDIKYIKQNVR